MKYGIVSGILVVCILACVPSAIGAQVLTPDTQVLMKARVLSVENERTELIPGTDTPAQYQRITAQVLDGPESGETISIENDYLVLKPGEVFFAQHISSQFDGLDYYTVVEPYRLPWIWGVVALFLFVAIVIGGKQGLRALVALAGSFALIFYVLLPGILAGHSPVLVAMGVASVIVVFGSYVTHGVSRTTTAAVLGMIITILLTGVLAYVVTSGAQLSGFTSDEAVALNFNLRGAVSLSGLLLAGILIGLLGVLYDAAIGQAVAIDELIRIGPHLSRKFIFARAMRIGREHIGALVNTLAIAYVGASLPLLLFVYSASSASLGFTLNQEIFATEIVRAMVGSIGLVLAVPITSIVAVMLLHRGSRAPAVEVAEERREVENYTHHH